MSTNVPTAQFEERYWTQTTGLTLPRSSCNREWGPPSFVVAVVPIFRRQWLSRTYGRASPLNAPAVLAEGETTLAASGFNGVAGRVTMTPTKVRDAELPPNGDEID